MDHEVDISVGVRPMTSKIAKNKQIFSTQLPTALIEELKAFSEMKAIPMTILLDNWISYCLAEAKKGNFIMKPDREG